MTEEQPAGFKVLTGEETIVKRSTPRETSEMWRQIVNGQRVFIPGYKPGQLTYWYRKAKAAGFKLTMALVTVDDVKGTIMEREFTPDYHGGATEASAPAEV